MNEASDDMSGLVVTELSQVKKNLKDGVIEKLKDHDWMEQMKLKALGYIRANGSKNLTSEEVLEFVLKGGLSSFPQDIKDQMMEDSKIFINKLSELSSLGITDFNNDAGEL